MRTFILLSVVLLLVSAPQLHQNHLANVAAADRLREEAAAAQARAEEARREKELAQTILRRLTAERVIADIVILGQRASASGSLATILSIRLKPPPGSAARPLVIPPLTIEGDVIYFESHILRFEDKYVAMADPERGRALVLLTRVFGEQQRPVDGLPLGDRTGVPTYYRLEPGDPSTTESALWARFWHFCTHRAEAKELGIEVAYGQAAFTKADPDLIYELVTDNRGAMHVRQKL